MLAIWTQAMGQNNLSGLICGIIVAVGVNLLDTGDIYEIKKKAALLSQGEILAAMKHKECATLLQLCSASPLLQPSTTNFPLNELAQSFLLLLNDAQSTPQQTELDSSLGVPSDEFVESESEYPRTSEP
ncbi:hypothetical protein MP228_006315 [Amoeboaphelidium protococcarum]|nr:hypothetical protein MP228_006315 [Amoeboaphelidium protococcarum]